MRNSWCDGKKKNNVFILTSKTWKHNNATTPPEEVGSIFDAVWHIYYSLLFLLFPPKHMELPTPRDVYITCYQQALVNFLRFNELDIKSSNEQGKN